MKLVSSVMLVQTVIIFSYYLLGLRNAHSFVVDVVESPGREVSEYPVPRPGVFAKKNILF